jgi:putative glutamine amidotransferase
MPSRSTAELALLAVALAAGVPVLGVCGGMQVLAVGLGGSLWQDLPADLDVHGHEQPHPKDEPSHEVTIAPGSLLSRLVGESSLRVNSTHHQAVREPGRGARISARSADDVVEAIEVPAHPFALGVQWHPESALAHEPRHLAIYAGLVDAARRRG